MLWYICASFCSDGGGFTFEKQLANQRQVSHGNEYSQYKNVPKIVAVLCHRLTELLDGVNCDPGLVQTVATWCDGHRCRVASTDPYQNHTLPSCDDGRCSMEYHCLKPKNEMEQYSPHHSVGGPGTPIGASRTSTEKVGKVTCDTSCDFKVSPSHLCNQYSHSGRSYDSWGVSIQRAMRVEQLKV